MCRCLQVVQHKILCPTILTRQGDRISALGKFGGTQNKAPPINTLQVFGAPLPQQYYNLKEQIGDLSHSHIWKFIFVVLFSQIVLWFLSFWSTDVLSRYRPALEKKDVREKERIKYFTEMRSPEKIKKQQEMIEKKKQLEEIERQLGMFVEYKNKFQAFCFLFL